MHTYNRFFAVIVPTAFLSGACANVAAMPTGPSERNSVTATLAVPAVLAQDFPSLTGQWRASGTTAFRNLATGNTLNWGGCSGAFTVDKQDNQRFTGLLNTEGRGWNSDRFCTTSVTFNGEMLERDGSVARAWLEGNSAAGLVPRCRLPASSLQRAMASGSAARQATPFVFRSATGYGVPRTSTEVSLECRWPTLSERCPWCSSAGK